MFRIYVGSLSSQTTEETLRDLFAQHGSVNNTSIIIDRISGRSRGFAFVEMNDAGEAKAAMQAIDGRELNGRTLKVSESRGRTDHTARP